jgi:N,N'-diacetyllegionaminate synthase
MSRVFVIAEAGVNHNGNIEIARKMIDVAAEAGADAVKFQTFRAQNVATRQAGKADYQSRFTSESESQLEMLTKLELSEENHIELINHCEEKGIGFISSSFDLDSIALLNRLGLRIFKIPSGEVTNFPYLREIGKLGKPVIMATGMSDVREIEEALKVLTEAGTERDKISLLHCTTEYPTLFPDVNLKAMETMRRTFGLKVGYSDHTTGIEVAVAAVAMGADIIEKHFTLDRGMTGPDHQASVDPVQLSGMVRAIRNIEMSMGSGVKQPTEAELRNRSVARKSIVASKTITAGETFSEDNITTKRPGTGINPMRWMQVIGLKAARDFQEDEFIEI